MIEQIELQEQPPLQEQPHIVIQPIPDDSDIPSGEPPIKAPTPRKVPLSVTPTIKLRGKDVAIDKIDLGGVFRNPLDNKEITKKGKKAIDDALELETKKVQHIVDIAENIALNISPKEGETVNEDTLDTVLSEIASQGQYDDLLAVKRLFAISFSSYNKGLSERTKNRFGLSNDLKVIEPFDPFDKKDSKDDEDQTPIEEHHNNN
ncbi:hypothetical protein BPT24_226 [Tenacibaculum phage pT24]|uniref:Uncharacterized protein n=1 Tax=Tenacibaculum phage pT24 TaxID=1880590 RepID=A0A1B4XX17_9CAUD|nr:hypothetical protein HYP10_gp226 [Tenacibaculum phage pT24]BAV39350.1 hypothetical protein BPT24_226 [Tenacibaculum phage pT24]